MQNGPRSTTILGVRFFGGTAKQAVERMRSGGVLVVPAAPALKEIETDEGYREALVNADLVLPDSGYMVLLWNLLQRDSIRRISGLEYLLALLADEEFRRPGARLWVMSSEGSARRNIDWLKTQGISLEADAVYVAPMYGEASRGAKGICDPVLLEMVQQTRPRNIVVTLGGGVQEQLALYLKLNAGYRPAIHCTGAALAFLSGDQVHIPMWADRLYLGWLFRSVSNPKLFFPRYWHARTLFHLMVRDRDRLPARVDKGRRADGPRLGPQ